MVKARVSKLLDRAEDPALTLDYSYERQLEQLQQVKRGLAEVVTSKKRVEIQMQKLTTQLAGLDDQAKQALKSGREDLATRILEKKHATTDQLNTLGAQIESLEAEQQKLETLESRLRVKVEAFRTQKEVIKAQYGAAEAQVRIGEAATGLSEELADVGLAVERAQNRTDEMRARAGAIDELIENGVLDDMTATTDSLEAEINRVSSQQRISDDLARLKAEVGA